MFSVNENAIRLTRGDTFVATISLTQDNEPYTPVQGDIIRFIVKKAGLTANRTEYVDKTVRISKTIPIATMQLRLDPTDTKGLPFGDYVYDLEIKFASGVVDTVIEGAPFVLTPEVD